MTEKTFVEKITNIPVVGDIVDIIFGSPEVKDGDTKKSYVKAYKETDARTTSPDVTYTSSGITYRSTAGDPISKSSSQLRAAGFTNESIAAFNAILQAAARNRSIGNQFSQSGRTTPNRPSSVNIRQGFTSVNMPKLPFKDKKDETAV
tara:strand:+ start:697 stop:1140 length:444 start_codon:yes stop_codon:yes gene_type:complete